MYALNFDSAVIDFLNKLDKETAKRIWNKIILSKENPHRYFERLVERTDYKLRVGDYRIIADISDESKTIQITLVGKRDIVYKKK
jgi:mRNA interferase RelE/StbE